MPKCLECGVELPRLQWTHFKYKCTGRFSNGREYQEFYKGAKLVDDDIAKKTSLTLGNFIKKYGKGVGTEKWNEYRQKQAYSNTFEYKKQKHGWSEEDYSEFNKSRAVTLENFIKKYGIEEATEKFDRYCKRQAYTCSEEYFIETYGLDEGRRKYNNFAKIRVGNVLRLYSQGISKIENEAYNALKCVCPAIEHQVTLDGSYFGPYDFGSIERKKVIEFYGSYWHCDARIYEASYHHSQIDKNARAIWNHDARKRSYALNQGYKVYVIWEMDWMNDRENVIEKVKRWWSES